MIAPVFTVTSNAEQVSAHFDKLPLALRSNLRKSIAELTNQLLAQVRSLEPSRTGALRADTRAFVDEGENFVRGRVRVLGGPRLNIAFAALEYGVKRQSVAVGAYQRRGIAVRAYERQAHIAARRFLRGPEQAMQQRALAEIQAAVDKSIAESAG
jgi:hypothetical protein